MFVIGNVSSCEPCPGCWSLRRRAAVRSTKTDLSADERTLKLMGQPLSLASLPECSAPPAVALYPGEKPFSGPLPRSRFLVLVSLLCFILFFYLRSNCVSLFPFSHFPEFPHLKEEMKRSSFIPFKGGVSSTSYTKVHVCTQSLVTG